MTELMASPDPREGWFVVWTESRAEKKVESRIAAQGLEPWLPKVIERRKWSNRWRDVGLPLFPGYVWRLVVWTAASLLRSALHS